MNERQRFALKVANELCARENVKPLFLTFFGSELYGTSVPGKSDTDLRGIFLPAPGSLLLQEAKSALQYSTGNAASRNGSDDIDISLWSLQKWLLELLPGGDIGAIDLLFAPSNPDCVILISPLLEDVFSNPLRLLDLSDSSACVRYCIGQAKKYGIRGSRLAVLKKAAEFIAGYQASSDERLGAIADAIIDACEDRRYCDWIETASGAALKLCGKLHGPEIKITEFRKRLAMELKRYPGLSSDYTMNKAVDYKALSHALRAAMQMEELLETGRIIFPLKRRCELIRVKMGEFSWQELEPLILGQLERVKRLCAGRSANLDRNFGRQVVLNCYTVAI